MSDRLSKAEQNALIDDRYRDHLDDTYGTEEFSRDAAQDEFLSNEGIDSSSWIYPEVKPAVRRSWERVRRELVHGRERYWYTQGRGHDATYQVPAAVAEDTLAHRANCYMATATGLVRLAGEHIAELKSRGVQVDEAALEALQEMVDAIA